MREAKNLMRLINVISLLLIAEPLLKVLVLKSQTGLEWSLIWSNIQENSQTFSRFFSFWVLSPLTGVFLLTYSTTAYALYFGLTLYKVYALITFEAFTWPYMSKYPHASAYLFEFVNLILMGYLFYPIVQRFILSRYLRNVWDARGRVDCNVKAILVFNESGTFLDGEIQNMSSGGVSVLTKSLNSSFNEGKILFHDHTGTPICFDFKVKSKRGPENQTTLGLEFLGVGPKEKIYLRSLLKEMENKQPLFKAI